MNRTTKAGKATIGIYVDDILLTCSHPSLADTIIQDLEKEYKQLKVTRGTTHNYLGMILDFTHKGVVHICQSGMIEEITRAPGVDTLTAALGLTEENPKTPGFEYLFRSSDHSPVLDPPLIEIVHSLTARILFVANRARDLRVLHDQESPLPHSRRRQETPPRTALPGTHVQVGAHPRLQR